MATLELTEVATIILDSGENDVHSLAISGDYLYAGLYTSPGKIAKIDLTTFTHTDTLTLDTDDDLVNDLAISGNYLYAGLRQIPGRVAKIDLTTFTKVETLTLDTDPKVLWGINISGNYLYAGVNYGSTLRKIKKIDLTTFTVASELDLRTAIPGLTGAYATYYGTISDNILYITFYKGTVAGRIVRINLATFTVVDYLTLDTGETNPHDAVVYGNYLYVSLSTNPYALKIDLTTFTQVDHISDIEAGQYQLVMLNGLLYFPVGGSPAKVHQSDPVEATITDSLTLSSGNNTAVVLAASGNHLYAGLDISPGRIVKIGFITIYPTDPLLRASGIVRTFWAGIGGQSVYQTVLTVGGIGTTFVSPISSREPPSAVTPTPTPSGAGYLKEDYLLWIRQTDWLVIIRMFGHFPLYDEWLQWRQSGGIVRW